jgi:hypothetical protein
MAAEHPDLTYVERTMERRMRLLGLRAQVIKSGVRTGFERLDIVRSLVQYVRPNDPKSGGQLHVAVEFRAAINHPAIGRADICDLITVYGDTLERFLERCANAYMDTTFPALHSLFLGHAASGVTEIKMSSFVPA